MFGGAIVGGSRFDFGRIGQVQLLHLFSLSQRYSEAQRVFQGNDVGMDGHAHSHIIPSVVDYKRFAGFGRLNTHLLTIRPPPAVECSMFRSPHLCSPSSLARTYMERNSFLVASH